MPRFHCADAAPLPPEVADSYRRTMQLLNAAGLRYVVGGAYALAYYTGAVRHTKDLDLFIRPADRDGIMKALAEAGYSTQVVFPYWLAKAFAGEHMIDLIYRAPNGIVEVTEQWFARARACELLGIQVPLCAPEEILSTKLFVRNNDRNDLADVMHLFCSCAEEIDWSHLLGLLGPHWRVLLADLVLFGYVYPSERQRIPVELLERLVGRLLKEHRARKPLPRVCNGPLFSYSQYNVDLASGWFEDGRLKPNGPMTPLDVLDSTISVDDPNRAKLIEKVKRG